MTGGTVPDRTAPARSRPGRDRKAVLHPARGGHPDVGHLPHRPRVAVVGAGIAGLAAATCLAERGVDVRLLEREHYLGGRVGGWRTELVDGSVASMNRGFHAFFRQYYNLRNLLRRADPALTGLVGMPDYPLVHSDGYRDTFAGLPRTPPLNALAFVARSPTFTWRDVTKLRTRAALPLAHVSVPDTYEQLDHLDAASFLDRIGFPKAAQHLAFEVFSRSFFADPTELSAAELITMFHIYFLGSSEGLLFDVASDCFPQALWQPLQHYLTQRDVHLHTGTSVESVRFGHRRRFHVRCTPPLRGHGEELDVDAVVLATDPAGLRTLVQHSPQLGDSTWQRSIADLPSAPPFLVSRLWLDRPIAGDRPGFLGTSGYGPLDNISVLERYEHSASEWAHRHDGSVLELHAYALAGTPTVEQLRPRVLAELHRIYPETARAGIVDERHELRADCPLFPPGGFRDRPGVRTPDPHLVLAGDLVRVDLPVALMERAATTGMCAANELLAGWDTRGHALWSVPDRGRFAALRRLAPAH
ncbi:isorenieratene synthase [Halopolyspora algeriensis]|uniref:Isorenieratene synthase n=1 Tax=Halopolyspora algeriensis TaxID=1500506 RepID=A0A368W0Q9_9ACTN|nr:NAD(P)/FAD-dependent oxidoreductase [Halopolyspora algeriensis]RCW46171.1 isorenieratene synthase [Halopolyspora algeriensis]TQM55574.1 isorenieratene synthase [Halopolyspora algeriensis]